MVTMSILLSHQIEQKKVPKWNKHVYTKVTKACRMSCKNLKFGPSGGCLLCSITGDSRLVVSLVWLISLYKITAKDMKSANTNSPCHSKQQTTNYQANQHLMRLSEWITDWCCWCVRKTIFTFFFALTLLLMSLSHQIDTVLSKRNPQRYQDHHIISNLFSSSVKIMNEGVDKHSMEEKSFRIHSFSYLAATLLSGQIFCRWTFLQAKYIHRTRFIRHVLFEGLTQ